MIRLCIFDLDGTTVDSLASIAYFANRTLEKYGFAPFPTDDYRRLAGGGARKLWGNLVRETGADPALLEPMMNDWIGRYAEDFLYLTRPYDGIAQMLAGLKELGAHTAIVTNKDKRIADQICGTLFGTDGKLLDVCVSDHPGMVLKPQPDELLALMRRYGAAPRECIYCGDHDIDMRTGKNAGVFTVGVTWGFHTREALTAAGADMIADDPAQIVRYVRAAQADGGIGG